MSVEEIFQAHADSAWWRPSAASTAAVISPIGKLGWGERDIVINEGRIGEISQRLYDTMTGIQTGRLEDPFGWTVEVEGWAGSRKLPRVAGHGAFLCLGEAWILKISISRPSSRSRGAAPRQMGSSRRRKAQPSLKEYNRDKEQSDEEKRPHNSENHQAHSADDKGHRNAD